MEMYTEVLYKYRYNVATKQNRPLQCITICKAIHTVRSIGFSYCPSENVGSQKGATVSVFQGKEGEKAKSKEAVMKALNHPQWPEATEKTAEGG